MECDYTNITLLTGDIVANTEDLQPWFDKHLKPA